MQSIHVDYAVTYPEGKVSRDVSRRDIDIIANHFYDGLNNQCNNQPTMSSGGGGDLDDLSKLSDAERGLVLEVLRRDEELREKEFTRIEVLKSEVEALQRRLAAHKSEGRDRSRKRCSLCPASFGWIFSRGDLCRRCQETRVCGNCRQTTTTIERWICLLCYKKQQLYLKSGSWFHRTFSGRRRLRRRTESESSTLTFRKDVDRASSVGIDNGASPTSKSFASATLPRTKKEQSPPTPNTLAIGDVGTGHLLTPDPTGGCAYPDENDRELLMLLSRSMNGKDQALSTDVGLVPSQPPQDLPADSVARRRADAEVFRRGHLVAKKCLSDEFPQWSRNYDTQGLRSYGTYEDLSSTFRDDGSESTNSTRIGKEATDAEPEPCNGSISSADKIPEQISLENETGDYIRQTSSRGQEVSSLRRNEPNKGISDESHVSKEFQPCDLTGTERKSPGTERKSPGTERKSPGTERKSPGTERKSPGTERKSPGTERKPPVTGRGSYDTNDSEYSNLSSWSDEALLGGFPPEITRQEVQTIDGSRSDAEESLISVRSEDLNSKTFEIDLDLLAWKAEIEQLFQSPSLTYDQDWEDEIDSLGVLRDMVVWSRSADGGKGSGTDPLHGNCLPSLPSLEDVSSFVVDTSQPIMVEVSEEEKRMGLLPQQQRRYLRVFNDEDSLSIISERTEPTGSDQVSIDLDLPASEADWQSDAFDASDEESLGITLTDAGIDRAIDRIVDHEVQLCPPPCDLDAEMDRLVITNQDHLSRSLAMSTLTKNQVDEPHSSYIQVNEHPGSSFHSKQEDIDDDTNVSNNCESFLNTYSIRSSNSLPSGSNIQNSASDKKPDVPLLSRYCDLDDATISHPVSNNSLTVVNRNRLINSPQIIQPLSENSVYPSYNVNGREYLILDPLENGTESTEAVNNSARQRFRSEARTSNGELSSDVINSANVEKLDYVSSIDEKTKELGKETPGGSSGSDSLSPDDWKNGDENQNDTNEVAFNQMTSIHCSAKQ